jgi:hypothetical protein
MGQDILQCAQAPKAALLKVFGRLISSPVRRSASRPQLFNLCGVVSAREHEIDGRAIRFVSNRVMVANGLCLAFQTF